MKYPITLIRGDGIGPEVADAEKVYNAVVAVIKKSIDIPHDLGSSANTKQYVNAIIDNMK